MLILIVIVSQTQTQKNDIGSYQHAKLESKPNIFYSYSYSQVKFLFLITDSRRGRVSIAQR
jgi:hypothetical protein